MASTLALPSPTAMANDRTFGDLFKAKALLEADLDAAVEAYMADPSLTTFVLGEGCALNPHDAVSASPFALGVLSKPDAEPASKRGVLRTAILLSRPVKGRAMTEHEAGYLQALKGTLITVRQMVNDLGLSPEGKVELLGVVSLLGGLIEMKVQRHGDHDDQDEPDPLSGGV